MAKQKKKRNKVYRGADASISTPQVIRVEAANRNKVSQWWFEKKKIVKPVAIAVVVIIILIWLIFELLALFCKVVFFGFNGRRNPNVLPLPS